MHAKKRVLGSKDDLKNRIRLTAMRNVTNLTEPSGNQRSECLMGKAWPTAPSSSMVTPASSREDCGEWPDLNGELKGGGLLGGPLAPIGSG